METLLLKEEPALMPFLPKLRVRFLYVPVLLMALFHQLSMMGSYNDAYISLS